MQLLASLQTWHQKTCCLQVFQLHLSLIAQLEAIGQMPHWAVFVALHVPDHPSPSWANLRTGLVHELIMRHAPFWASNSGAREFLLHQLQLPASWLEQSLAHWAKYCRDESGTLPLTCNAGPSSVLVHELITRHILFKPVICAMCSSLCKLS